MCSSDLATVEDQVLARLRTIDTEAERLRSVRTELQTTRSRALASIETAGTGLTTAEARRNETAAALAAAEADLEPDLPARRHEQRPWIKEGRIERAGLRECDPEARQQMLDQLLAALG